ncbi:MAG: copper chaperone CopZ [Bacilli bacterium]|nr:copper chaperone CopZ [Bacilli bacterium]MDD4608364.1 copper chaperone CopZ [Bacilli bacterium]
MEKIVLQVEGMSCDHCVKSIKKSVNELPGVAQVEVSLSDKTVMVEYDNTKVKVEQIKSVIEEQGYEIIA